MAFNNYQLMLSVVLCFAGPGLSKIVRPCDLDDYECIGMNLAANSNCDPKVAGEVPNVIHRKIWHFETPFFNTSNIDRKVIAKNLDQCTIAEFFVNTKTKRAVIGIECPNMDILSHRTAIVHRTYEEDSYHHYHVRAVYPLLRVTANLPLATEMDLCSAYIYTDVVELPTITVYNSESYAAKARDYSKLHIFEREICSQRGPAIAYVVIDALLCNFGCKIPT